MSEDYISTGDASLVLGRSPARIRQLIKEGKLYAQKAGRDYQLAREEVEAYAASVHPGPGRPPNAAKRDRATTTRIMSAVRSKDTRPELLLRSELHRRKLRFRCHATELPGRPDLIFPRAKIAIFVDGDFWHGNAWRVRGLESFRAQFKKNQLFWIRKITRNMARDTQVNNELAEKGWRVLRVWESAIEENLHKCADRVERAVKDTVLLRDFTSIELFAGAGGMALGLEQAGFRHLILTDWHTHACNTLRANGSNRVAFTDADLHIFDGDVRDLSYTGVGDVDLLAGGPPCQPFSLGGQHRGHEDERNMFPEMFRAMREIRPKAVLIENVKGLTRTGFKPFLEYLLLQMEMPYVLRRKGQDWEAHKRRLTRERKTQVNQRLLSYDVSYRVLNCADFGVPQKRERVFFVAFRSDLRIHWGWPEPTHLRELLKHAQERGGTYWKRHRLSAPTSEPSANGRLAADIFTKSPWMTVRDALADLPAPTEKENGFQGHVLIPGARAYRGHTGSILDLPAKALKAGVHGVPGGENTIVLDDGSIRYLTVREAARLQCFPDEYEITGSWSEAMRQLGNAVPVRMGRVLGEGIMKAIAYA